jgi:RHS repeat-associated protein
MFERFRLTLVVSILGLMCCPAHAQLPLGTPVFNQFSHSGDGGGEVNVSNLDIHIEIPLRSLGAYGPPASAKLVMDTGLPTQESLNDSLEYVPNPTTPHGFTLETSVSDLVYIAVATDLASAPSNCPSGTFWVSFGAQGVLDRSGTYHPTSTISPTECNQFVQSGPGSDGWAIAAEETGGISGNIYLYAISPTGDYTETTGIGGTVFIVQGNPNAFLLHPHAIPTPATTYDLHGNSVANSMGIQAYQNASNVNTMTASGSLTDALNNTVLTASLQSSSNSTGVVTLTYPGPNSTTSTYTLTYTWLNLTVNFGCTSGFVYTGQGYQYTGGNPTAMLTKIQMPDNSTMSFSYEPSSVVSGQYTGRIASVMLTTGATITYQYQGGTNGINCVDGSTAGFTKTTPDGTWTYAHTAPSGCNGIDACLGTTTVTAPSGDYTVYTFDQMVTEAYPQPLNTLPVQQVACASGVSLSTCLAGTNLGSTVVCYNGNELPATGQNPSNCTYAPYIPPLQFPITERTVFTYVPGVSDPAAVDYLYNQGLLIQAAHFDFGKWSPGPGDGENYGWSYEEQSSYQSGVTETIQGASVPVVGLLTQTDEEANTSGGAVLTELADFSYDVHGNLVTKKEWYGATLSSTATFTYGYDALGRETSSSGPNGEANSTVYDQCSGTLPSSFSMTVPSGSLASSFSWNCGSETIASYTDYNGHPWQLSYGSDPFWRVTSATDPMNNVTSYAYTPNTTDVRQLVTKSAVNETLTTMDTMGRKHLVQERQGPSSTSYNTIETDYDSNGRVKRITLPYSAAAGATNSTIKGYAFSYDGISRIIDAVSPLGTTKLASYTANDTLVTLSPAPSGEDTKSMQYETNGLGWLTSVCEVTSTTMSGSYACGQANAENGFLTAYNYGPTGNITSIVQNSKGSTSQTRSFTYENNNTGRLLTSTTPEAGTLTTVYDSDPSGVCSSAFVGFPIKVVDNGGGTSCFSYDVADRISTKSFPQGLNSSITPTRTFIYDTTSNTNINCATKNQAGAVAEVITGPSGNPITDEGFCYDNDGRPTDSFLWTSTGHGYAHITESYYANGVVDTLSVPTQPTITYALNGLGRITSATASSGQNPLTSTAYNVADMPTTVTLGSGDKDVYAWSNTIGPMTSATYGVGSSNVTNSLTWNPNGSLKKLVIADPLNPSDAQTCTYTYDDLERIVTDNCGTAWNESFSYDPFGNVTKTGSAPWPTTGGYNQTNNQYSATPSPFDYDANGRLTKDTFDSLGWDVEGNLVTQSATTLVYDASNRPVMAGATQYLYAPDGSYVATENSSGTILKMFVPVPMGQAVYSGGTLSYYNRHDWLGSVRVASTPSQTLYSDNAYDAFGIPYAPMGSVNSQFAGLTSDLSSGSEQVSDTRRYHPTQGRWQSPDPIIPDLSSPQTFNAYHYSMNAPTSVTDPGGQQENVDNGYSDPGDPGFCCEDWDPLGILGQSDDTIYGTYEADLVFSVNPAMDLTFYGVANSSSDSSSLGGPTNYLAIQQSDQNMLAQMHLGQISPAAQATSSVGAPGFWEGLIPIWGSGRAAINDFQTGHWGWGIVNTGLAISDVFLVKSLVTAAGKVGVEGLAKLAGSNAWGATRSWLAREGWTEFAGQQFHHWLIPQRTWGTVVPDIIKNQPWNLMRMPEGAAGQALHTMLHGGVTGAGESMNMAQRLWFGSPGWAKVLTGDMLLRGATQYAPQQ